MVEPAVLTKAELLSSAQKVSISEKKLVMETVKRLLENQAVEKFSLLKDLVIDAEMIRTLDILLSVTKLIFEKAVLEPDFSHFYAQLCSDLIEKIPPLPSEELDGMVITVSQILVHNFQKVLECTGNLIGEIGNMTGLDQELEHTDKERMVKTRLVGSICLLGELYKNKIFKKKIVHCVIKQPLENDNEETHLEEAKVEAICILFNSIGNQLDGHPQFNVYFNRLNELAINPHIEPRWRHILRDILDQHAKKLIKGLNVVFFFSIFNKDHKLILIKQSQMLVEPAPALNEAELPLSSRRVNMSDKEWVLESVQCILNRQIPQKFGVLANLLINAEMITTPDILQGVTNIIFEKAILEPDFSSKYAVLFSQLIEGISPFPPNESDGRMLSLKRVLLNKCQEVYEDTNNQLAKMVNQDQDLENSDNERLVKLRYVGTICLTGELYKQRLVTYRILCHIIMKLLNEKDDTRLLEVNMEAICRLFNSIGNQLDGQPFSDVYINQLKELALMPKVEPQWRLMLHNILDKVSGKWIKGEVEPAPALNEAELPSSSRRVNLSDKEWVLESVQRILNRQIPQKFGVLANLLINAEMITTPDILQGVTDIIFKNAIFQPYFSQMYAALFSRLIEGISPFPTNESDGRMLSLKRVLLNKCQKVYEDTNNRLVKMANQGQDLENIDDEGLVKLCYFGTICLIGELYKQREVPKKILYSIIMELLNEKDDTRLLGVNIEAICRLFNSIGNQLDGKPLSGVFINRLKELALMPKVKPRWRLMLHNILDKSSGKWIKGEMMPCVKTRICNKYNTTEGCKLGDMCKFAHGERELGMLIHPVAPQVVKTVLPRVKTRICDKYNTTDGCKLGDLCSFAHGARELGNFIPSHDGPVTVERMLGFKTRICNKYNTAEGCKFGDLCNFAHGEQELDLWLL